MAARPAITVILPVHNRERFVGIALESLRTQTFTDFQVLIVDDASTDGTAAILSLCNDPRFRVLHNTERAGVAGARNLALDLADTEYIAFFDSDDICHPRRFELQIAFLRAHEDVHLVASRIAVIDEGGAPTGAIWGPEASDDTIPASMLFVNSIATSTVLVRRTLIHDSRFDRTLNPVEDYDMWLRLLDRGRASCLPEALVQYRLHAASLMHTSGASEDGLRRIAHERLTRLGVTPTVAELDLHRDLGAGRPRGTAAYLAGVARWLDTLESANTGTQVYAPPIFRAMLSRRWLVACDAAARGGAWSAWRLILRSRFSSQLLNEPSTARHLLSLPWWTLRGFVRRRWPGIGASVRAVSIR